MIGKASTASQKELLTYRTNGLSYRIDDDGFISDNRDVEGWGYFVDFVDHNNEQMEWKDSSSMTAAPTVTSTFSKNIPIPKGTEDVEEEEIREPLGDMKSLQWALKRC
jgi:hypothetical protein